MHEKTEMPTACCSSSFSNPRDEIDMHDKTAIEKACCQSDFCGQRQFDILESQIVPLIRHNPRFVLEALELEPAVECARL